MNISNRFLGIFPSTIPSVFSIIAAEIMTISLFLYGPIRENKLYLLAWVLVQFISGFIFAHFSDKHYRKKVLVYCQLVGVVAGTILMIFGMQVAVMIVIGLFNPLPIARGALLDNFPKHSSLRIIALTYAAQFGTWIFFKWMGTVDYRAVIIFDLGLLGLNIFLTLFLFKDKYDNPERVKHKQHTSFSGLIKMILKSKPLLLTLLAFSLAESGFYLLLDYFEYVPQAKSYFTIASVATVIGITLALFWRSIPHKSIISICFLLGGAANFLVVYRNIFIDSFPYISNLMMGMDTYAIIGGFYLPMVVDLFIKILGPEHKAIGASLAEFGDTIATFVGSLLSFVKITPFMAPIVLVFFYVLAAFFQKQGEKTISKKLA